MHYPKACELCVSSSKLAQKEEKRKLKERKKRRNENCAKIDRAAHSWHLPESRLTEVLLVRPCECASMFVCACVCNVCVCVCVCVFV